MSVTVDLVVQSTRSEFDAGDLWDRIEDALSAIPGVTVEMGAGHVMDTSDVVVDSPLDHWIKGDSDA